MSSRPISFLILMVSGILMLIQACAASGGEELCEDGRFLRDGECICIDGKDGNGNICTNDPGDIFGNKKVVTCDSVSFEALEIGDKASGGCTVEVVGADTIITGVSVSETTPDSFEITSWKDGDGEEVWPMVLGAEIPLKRSKPHSFSVRYKANATCGESGAIIIHTELDDKNIPLFSSAVVDTEFQTEPGTLNFGKVSYTGPGEGQSTLPLVLKNKAEAGTLSITDISFSNSGQEHFSFDTTGACATPFTISPGQNRTCQALFKPMDTGIRKEYLEIEVEAEAGSCTGAVQMIGDTCIPYCKGKECGDDGCEGSCGDCEGDMVCYQFSCCEPECEDKECGNDLCGGQCGECAEQHDCINFECICVPDCTNKECGDDGCGGSCGACAGDCRNNRCCICSSGTCCNGCTFDESSKICNSKYDTRYQCDGYCGGEGQKSTATQSCSGYSPSCNGSIEWSEWKRERSCAATQYCLSDSDGITCTDSDSCCDSECEADERTCASAASYQVCIYDGESGCYVWSDPTSCGGTSFCTNGYCQ